jgi:hypothetical protein
MFRALIPLFECVVQFVVDYDLVACRRASANLPFLRLQDSAGANDRTIILDIQPTYNKIVRTRTRILKQNIKGFGKPLATIRVPL